MIDPADVERLLDQREAQGLPRTVTDPAALAKVATVLTATEVPHARAS